MSRTNTFLWDFEIKITQKRFLAHQMYVIWKKTFTLLWFAKRYPLAKSEQWALIFVLKMKCRGSVAKRLLHEPQRNHVIPLFWIAFAKTPGRRMMIASPEWKFIFSSAMRLCFSLWSNITWFSSLISCVSRMLYAQAHTWNWIGWFGKLFCAILLKLLLARHLSTSSFKCINLFYTSSYSFICFFVRGCNNRIR